MIATGPGWEMRLGDCIAGMRELADDSVDVTITDPPYDEHTHKAGRRGITGIDETKTRSNGAGAKRAQTNRARSLGFEAISSDQMAAAADQFARVARRWTLVFCAVEMVGDSAKDGGRGWRAAGERAGLEYVRTCVWHKLGCTPQFTGDRPAQAVEAIVCFHRPGKKRWNSGGKHGYYAHPIVLNRGGVENRCHTTQKPLSLVLELVGDFSEPGELVLDGFAGSGTTGVACVQHGRRFVGWELARCARCLLTAEWMCSWMEGDKPQSANLCDEHRDEVASKNGFDAVQDNYFKVACRRLRGERAVLNKQQLDMFAGGAA